MALMREKRRPMISSDEITAEQLGQIVEEASSEVFLFSAHNFRFLMVNRGARNNLGYSMEELRLLTPWDIKPEFSQDEFLELVEPLVSGAAEMLNFETVHERSDGTRYDVAIRLQLMQSNGKSVYYASIQDISELRQTQKSLQESARRLDAILNNTTMAVFLMDERQHCVFMNAAAEQMTGFTLAEMQGNRLHDVIHHTLPDGRHFPIEECAIDRAFPDNNQTQGEEVFIHKNGSFYPVGFTASPVKDERGTTIGTIIEARNIEVELAARKTEEQLRESQKLETVGHLTGGVAHDFNNLLMVICGNAEMLADFDLPPEAKSMVDIIAKTADQGAELTSRLLSFARRQPLEPKVIRIAEYLASAGQLLGRTIPENISVEIRFEDNLWLAEADPGQLQNALINLAVNARDAMPDGGSLTIEASNIALDEDYVRVDIGLKQGEYVQISVTDSGHGMSPETLARAFDPFFTTKPVGQGTGLGLSMVYGFAKQSGWHLSIYSEPNQGTTVRLYLPRVNDAAEPVKTMMSERSLPKGGETILLVEDNAEVQAFVHKLLEILGYTVIAASNGSEALNALNGERSIDLLFTDVVMPGGMSGKDLAEAAVKLRPGLKVLYTSGYTENSIVHDGRLDQGVKLLSKPYGRERLANILRELLD
jgi:PAS domain S-box-containing protein